MKKTVYILLLAFLIIIPGCSINPVKLQGIVIFIHGTLKINNQDAFVGSRVKIDDTLSTGAESLAVIQISQTAVITLRSSSEIKFFNLSKNKDKSETVVLFLTRGTVFNKVIKKGTDYSIKTEIIVASVRGTSFEFSADGEKNRVSLLSGKVDIEKVSGSDSGGKAAVKIQLTEGMSVEAAADIIGEPVLLVSAEIDDLKQYDAIEPVADVEKTVPGPDETGGTKNLDLKGTRGIDVIPEQFKESILNNESSGEKGSDLKNGGFMPPQAAVKTLMNNENRTLEDIKKVFKRTDEISLYSGRVIKGAIVTRGNRVSILTPEGMVNVPMKEIQNVKVIK